MSNTDSEHLSVATALYQLDFYLKTLKLPFSSLDLYEMAYRDRRGEQYDDRWVRNIYDNPDVTVTVDQPFTTHTIVETLMRTGHEPIIRALMKEIRRRHIGFTSAYMVGMPRRP